MTLPKNLKLANPHVQAVFHILTSAFFFALMTFFVRDSGHLPLMEKCFFRNAIAALIAGITLARSKEKFHIQKAGIPYLAARCIFGTAGLIANFWAIDHLVLSDANMLNKMSPFFAMIASIFLLGEKPNKVEWGCLILAFVGTLFVIKPTAGVASLPALIGLFSGFGAGVAYANVRKLGTLGERGPVIVFAFSLFSCLIAVPFLIVDFVPMHLSQLLMLLAAGVSAAIAQFNITAAYQKAPAKEISVFDYSQVIFAALLSGIFLGVLPDAWSIIGYIIIIGTALSKWYYNVYIQKDYA